VFLTALRFLPASALAALGSILFVACSHQSVAHLDLQQTPAKSAYIFVPGYYGSALETANHTRVFITASEALFGSTSTSLETESLATPPSPVLSVEGVLRDVTVIGPIRVDVYGQFLDQLAVSAKAHNAQVFAFGYDWRKDLTETAADLDHLVDTLRARGFTRVTILAHSMGCLVTAYELGYGSQKLETAVLDWRGAKKINDVVLMAGPYQGVFSIFRNLQRGAILATNKKLLTRDSVASFPASYQLLPLSGAHMYTYSGAKFAVDLGDFNYWKKNQFGLLADQKISPEVRARREVFTQTQLRKAKAFMRAIAFKTDLAPNTAPNSVPNTLPEALRVLALAGHGHRTTASGFYDASSGHFLFDVDELSNAGLSDRLLEEDGDGTVVATSAILPPALAARAKVMHTTETHGRVFDDKEFSAELARFLK
jgi:pimeloyl-ACP methyl ester carboxylesterase